MQALGHYRKLVSYDDWANRETLASLRAVDSPPSGAVRFLAHVIGAEVLWIARLVEQPSSLPVWPELSLAECDEALVRLPEQWHDYLSDLDEEELTSSISYTNSKGEDWTSTVESVLMHVVMHSAYHRGQIASLVRAQGETPAYTDYIHGARSGLFR